MALKTDDCDIRDVRFYMEIGGNGDYYLNLVEYDQNGSYIKSINMRISTSGGFAPHAVKILISSLYREMEQAGLNNHPQNEVNEIKPDGWPFVCHICGSQDCESDHK